MTRTYLLEWGPTWTARVEIKGGKESTDAILEMVHFWSGHEQRLLEVAGNYRMAFLKQLGVKLATMAFWSNGNAIMREFKEGIEGWTKMDGSSGITLIACDGWEIDDFEISVTEES